MMTSVSIVREKETGTMEVLLVSPFNPFWLSFQKPFRICFCRYQSYRNSYIKRYPFRNAYKWQSFTVISESTLLIICALSLGLLISNNTQSQQSAMLISMMGMLVPTMLFTGFMFPYRKYACSVAGH
jgi:ABC-2 type transport system permease protein